MCCMSAFEAWRVHKTRFDAIRFGAVKPHSEALSLSVLYALERLFVQDSSTIHLSPPIF